MLNNIVTLCIVIKAYGKEKRECGTMVSIKIDDLQKSWACGLLGSWSRLTIKPQRRPRRKATAATLLTQSSAPWPECSPYGSRLTLLMSSS